MELRNINTFLHVAELRSFSRAAEQLGYSQSAVTAQIQQLENELGVLLFDRINKTVRLTDSGTEFAGYARSLLRTAEQARNAMRKAPVESGPLRIGLAQSLCSAFFPELLRVYHRQYPAVQLILHTLTDAEMIDQLEHNEIDLIYTLDRQITRGSLIHALDVPERMCFIAPAGHTLAARAGVTLEELCEEEFILTEQGMSYRDQLDQQLAAWHLAMHPFLELGSTEVICSLVEQGLGLSFLPEYAARRGLAEGRLARLNVTGCTVEVWRQLLYHKDKWVTPQMKAFIRLAGLEDPDVLKDRA